MFCFVSVVTPGISQAQDQLRVLIISVNVNLRQHEDRPMVGSIQRRLVFVNSELSLRKISFLFVSQYSGLTFF